MPLLLSVIGPREPAVVLSATMSPPLVSALPLVSVNCTVIVAVELPSAVMLAVLLDMVELDSLAAPAIKFTPALSVMALPLTVPVIVADATEVELVKVAE